MVYYSNSSLCDCGVTQVSGRMGSRVMDDVSCCSHTSENIRLIWEHPILTLLHHWVMKSSGFWRLLFRGGRVENSGYFRREKRSRIEGNGSLSSLVGEEKLSRDHFPSHAANSEASRGAAWGCANPRNKPLHVSLTVILCTYGGWSP